MTRMSDAMATMVKTPALRVEAVKALYRSMPDPCDLMEHEFFTLKDLQELHEAVLGEPVKKDAFRRRMETFLIDTGDTVTTSEGGKPARVFRKP